MTSVVTLAPDEIWVAQSGLFSGLAIGLILSLPKKKGYTKCKSDCVRPVLGSRVNNFSRSICLKYFFRNLVKKKNLNQTSRRV